MKLVNRLSLLTTSALLATSLFAANPRALEVVPSDAVSVGTIRLDSLRSSQLANRLFAETNKAGFDGEGERFLREAGLKLSDDIDTVTFAVSEPKSATDGKMLVVAEGRFDVAKLSAAVAKRGAVKKVVGGKTLFLAPKDSGDNDEVAVSFVDKGLVLAGDVHSVTEALTALATGGTHFTQASGLAMDLSRIPSDADCWLLVDVPRSARLATGPKAPSNAPVAKDAFAATIKNVHTVSVWGKDNGDRLSFGGTAVTPDAETRTNLNDMFRGATAAWRMAAQEKKPELVDVIRGFKIDESGDAVTITGSIPTKLLQDFAKGGARAAASK